ncbi:glycosyltransferase family 4 protein [Archaeoglobus sulfaticallidus]|uniref:glycosyltransferase family 4 protein n=1 Tax=Archaeoglobus sulfaticallidus TaxID=1316941 RepID=UPI00064F6EEA|nr:glycosyltransferase family 4 protein [Archaeoglobus sulfaticallidus]
MNLITEEYDLYLTDEPFANGLLAFIISSIKNKPLTVTLRGWGDLTNAHNEYSNLKFFFLRLISNFVLSKADRIIVLSKATATELNKIYNLRRFYVIERPIDVKYYSGGKRSIKYSIPTILTVTNLRYKNKFRGVVEVIEVINKIKKKTGNDVVLLVAGGGKYLDELKEFAKKFDFVEVLGFRKDVPDVLASADIFVYVSYLDAFPSVILEAQAAGLPVICNNYGGLPESCGWAGIVVKDKKDLEQVLSKLLTNKKIQRKLRYKSYKKMKKYNAVAVEKYVRVWDETIKEYK